ncbi:ABC transporter permease subunit [Parafrankia sp. FMc6]|uniref:ABC transporter permease subunit n=1 Tax=Parafrankia soli TaxID=2599596 RepID=UPI0034D4D7EE
MSRRSRWRVSTPYLLVLPGGLWLVAFFVIPMLVMLSISVQTGNVVDGFRQTFNISVYWDAISTYDVQFVRSFVYGGLATLATILLAYPTILIAHAMFNISYVAVVVRARLAGFDTSVEEAARDLGAGPWTTFRLVTPPMITPGVLSAALLAFALSIDEYVITTFNAGSTLTFPLWVFGATRAGVPPQVNVLATIIFISGVTLALLNAVVLRRRRT